MKLSKYLLAGLAALVGSLLVSAPALADPAPDPQDSNVPYLAWRGEEVRLVKCHPAISPTGAGQRADLILVDWSGEEHALAIPHLEPSTAGFFEPSHPSKAGQGCVRGTFISQKAGLAQIKLVVSNIAAGGGAVGASITGPVGTPILKHDFLLGYMNINTATLALTRGTTTDVAGGPGNQLQVLVTGTIPLRANFRELGLGDTLTMPDDWPRLANVMATSSIPEDANPALKYWDIHDEFSPTASPDAELHGAQSACPIHNTTLFIDTVDNCTGLGFVLPIPEAAPPVPTTPFEIGFFSRIWQGFTAPTIGPFDPQRPQHTLLSNGVLDKGDAPMPAARIDFAIARNTGAATDISGVGSLAPADKHVVYSRDGLGTGTPHNLYGPFNAIWSPATSPSIINFLAGLVGLPLPPAALQQVLVREASGIDGPANFTEATCGKGNNFAGFLNQCAYHFWDHSRVLVRGIGGSSGCLLRFNTTFAPGGPGGTLIRTSTPVFRQRPSGPQTVVMYSDEHGEARVHFLPGLDFFFGNLGIPGNLNLGCDLQGVNPIGTATITATVRYPFEPVTARPVTTNAITKTVRSNFNKIVRCVPKGTAPNDQFAQICLVEARDISIPPGNPGPFVGEIVCFASNAELIQHFTGSTGTVLGGGGVIVNGTLLTPAEVAALGKVGAAVLCQRLDAGGRAAVEVFGKGPSNVIVDFVDEGLLRVITFSFPSGSGSTGTAEEITSTSPPTQEQINSINNAPTTVNTPVGPVTNTPDSKPEVTPPAAVAPAPHRIARAELVRPARGKPYLLVRVTGPAGKVSLRIRISAGRQALTSLRSVATNRLVKVQNLRVPNASGALRLSVSLAS